MVMRRPGRTAKVRPQDVLAIRADYATGQYSQPDLARKYGIGSGQIGKIVRGEAWTELTSGNPVITDSEGQLRQLTQPGPSQEEIEASKARLMRLLAVQEKRDIPEQYQGLDVSDPEEYRRRIQELVEQGRERTQHNGSAPPQPVPVPVRHNHEHEAAVKETATAAVNAEKLLETLKNEHSDLESRRNSSTDDRGGAGA